MKFYRLSLQSLYTNYCGIFYCIVQGDFIQAVDLDEITLRAIQLEEEDHF